MLHFISQREFMVPFVSQREEGHWEKGKQFTFVKFPFVFSMTS